MRQLFQAITCCSSAFQPLTVQPLHGTSRLPAPPPLPPCLLQPPQPPFFHILFPTCAGSCCPCSAYLKAENEHVAAVLADTEQLQGELYQEMRGRIQEADQSVPSRWGGRGLQEADQGRQGKSSSCTH